MSAMTVTAADLDVVLGCFDQALRPVVDRDWTRQAGDVEWDCRHTAEHVGDCLLSYAAQLVTAPVKGYVPMLATVEDGASNADALDVALTGGRLLAAAVRTTGPDVRAFHPTGLADAAGFAAMGCVELLMHGEDIATGLGVPERIDPPRDVCARVLARLFPEQDVEGDAWQALRWCAGRIELPGRPRRTGWKWRGAPFDE
jgi:hypothetical protein